MIVCFATEDLPEKLKARRRMAERAFPKLKIKFSTDLSGVPRHQPRGQKDIVPDKPCRGHVAAFVWIIGFIGSACSCFA